MTPRHLKRRMLIGAAALATLAAPAVRAERINGVIIGRDGWLFAPWDPPSLLDVAKVRRVCALVAEVGTILRRGGVELAISVPPARSRVYRDVLPTDVRIVPAIEGRYALALRELRAANLAVPDYAALFSRLRQAQPDRLLFFKADSHWTPEGAEGAAVEMASALAGRVRLPPSSRPGAALTEPEPMRHVGDLAALLPSANRARYPAEPFNVRQPGVVTGTTLVSLTNEETADVVVVGSSYMHPRYGFSHRLSHELRRPVGLTWAVHQNGPWKTLLLQLGSDAFRRARPKAIVWNILEFDLESMPDRADIWRANAMQPANFIAEVRRAVEA